MRLRESFIRWLERRYEQKLEKFCLMHRGSLKTDTALPPPGHHHSCNRYPHGTLWLLGIAAGYFYGIAAHRVHVAVPFNSHSVNQQEIHHER
jgi:hypothetical protein